MAAENEDFARKGMLLSETSMAAGSEPRTLSTSGGSSGRTFVGVAYAPGASASVRKSSNGAQLRVSGLPAPPAGRIYQVWLKRAAAAPVPTRALFATTTGSVTLPASLSGVQAVLVTAEPRPYGSRSPTRTPIIVVRLS